jgi:hypothetical protein
MSYLEVAKRGTILDTNLDTKAKLDTNTKLGTNTKLDTKAKPYAKKFILYPKPCFINIKKEEEKQEKKEIEKRLPRINLGNDDITFADSIHSIREYTTTDANIQTIINSYSGYTKQDYFIPYECKDKCCFICKDTVEFMLFIKNKCNICPNTRLVITTVDLLYMLKDECPYYFDRFKNRVKSKSSSCYCWDNEHPELV